MKAIPVTLLAGMICCTTVLHVSEGKAEKFKEKVLYSFGGGTDGVHPDASLIDVNGTLYGTTQQGGDSSCESPFGCGTVFAVNRTTGAETVLHAFSGGTDGAQPAASLIDVMGTLYGTTIAGGNGTSCGNMYGCGTVFSIDPSTGVETVLYSFCSQPNCTDGGYPYAGLVDVKGTLYGTTSGGGSGTVFSINPTTGAETVVYSFCSQPNCADGRYSIAGLIDVKGTLYGTTQWGGAYDLGTVFAVNRKTGSEQVVHSFGCSQQNCTDGVQPVASLIDVKGTLYGTTSAGGAQNDGGTAFSIDLSTGVETVLCSFPSQQYCLYGFAPDASLIQVKGALYGTTSTGQYGSGGTVFSLDPATGAETLLYSFCSQQNCTDGVAPFASLIYIESTLYGTTAFGGTGNCQYGCGTVFALKP